MSYVFESLVVRLNVASISSLLLPTEYRSVFTWLSSSLLLNPDAERNCSNHLINLIHSVGFKTGHFQALDLSGQVNTVVDDDSAYFLGALGSDEIDGLQITGKQMSLLMAIALNLN